MGGSNDSSCDGCNAQVHNTLRPSEPPHWNADERCELPERDSCRWFGLDAVSRLRRFRAGGTPRGGHVHDEPNDQGPTELHEMDPTGRFTDRASDYVLHRPDYPAAAIDHVLAGLGDPVRLVVADVGAGTGISARQVAARGARVLAVEPNAAMRAAATPGPRIEWREGTAEATGLDPKSVHLVLCAQAFHWFRQREALAEFHRILRPGGRLALVWNARDHGDPLTRGYIEAIHAVGGEHPAERREFDPTVVTAEGLFTPPALATAPHAQELDLEGLIGRATSASYVPKEGAAFTELRSRLVALHAAHADAGGRVRMRYVTRVHLATRLD